MKVLDIFCGTGYLTERIAARTKIIVIGIDLSDGMLKIAQNKCNKYCNFINCDVLDYLKKQFSNKFDIVTCGWGLGYSKPFKVLKEINRILKPNGKVGIIENTLLTIPEIQKSMIITIAEKPDILQNILRFEFPLSIHSLNLKLLLSGFHIQDSWKGIITYYEQSEEGIIKRLQDSSIVAGYEYMIKKEFREYFFQRMATIINSRYREKEGMPINHKYVGSIGIKLLQK